MTSLKLKEYSDDQLIIKRMKKSLIKSFKPTRENDIDKAVELSNYLLSLGKIEETTEFLNSFVYFDSSEQKDHLWEANVQGIILLAYIARMQQNNNKEIPLIELIHAEIIEDRLNYTEYDDYLSYFEDHKGKMEVAYSETQKYKCSIIGQEALTFLYFYEILPFYEKEAPKGFKEELKNLYQNCYLELRSALLTR